MSNFFLQKLNKQFLPADEHSEEIAKKFDEGCVFRCEAWKERNYLFHKKYFALLAVAFENQDKYDNGEAFRKEVIMRAGYYEKHVHLTGQASYTAKSISFKSMDEMEFEKLYQTSIDVILKHFLVGMEGEKLKEEVDRIVSFS